MGEINKLREVASQLVSSAIQRKKTIVTVESCTGGLVASSITDIPGSSHCFSHGLVTYSDTAKNKLLGIDSILIKDNGAVSKVIAKSMAKNALDDNSVDFSVAITGIAGPSGGSLDKPIGTVWIAWGYYIENDIVVDAQDYCFTGDRNAIRMQSAIEALKELEKSIKKLHSI